MLITILLLGNFYLLTACDYTHYLYHNTDGENLFLNKNVTCIKQIMYEDEVTQNDPLREHELDLSKLKVLETLRTNDIESFVGGLIKIGGLSANLEQVLNSPCGIGIRIIYDDGSFTLVTIALINSKECIFLGELFFWDWL